MSLLATEESPLLIVFVGLPRSGKTTLARKMSREECIPMVNPDSIRLALHGQQFYGPAEPWVWAMARTMAESLFLAGHQVVILDATNTTKERRSAWISKKWKTVFRLVDTTVDVCLERTTDAGLRAAIQRMATNWEPLGPDEARMF